MIKIEYNIRQAHVIANEIVTNKSVGIEAQFQFSADWDGLSKIVEFKGSGNTVDVALLESNECVIPHEVLTEYGGELKIGAYGVNTAGDVVIPTVWAVIGIIRQGTIPESETEPVPTQSVIDQILTTAGNAYTMASDALTKVDTVVDESLEAISEAKNDALSAISDATENLYQARDEAVQAAETAVNAKTDAEDALADATELIQTETAESAQNADKAETYYYLSRMQAATGGFLHLVNKNGRIYCIRTGNCGLDMKMENGRLFYGYTE